MEGIYLLKTTAMSNVSNLNKLRVKILLERFSLFYSFEDSFKEIKCSPFLVSLSALLPWKNFRNSFSSFKIFIIFRRLSAYFILLNYDFKKFLLLHTLGYSDAKKYYFLEQRLSPSFCYHHFWNRFDCPEKISYQKTIKQVDNEKSKEYDLYK